MRGGGSYVLKTSAQEITLLGDVTCNGEVSLTDVIILSQYLFGAKSLSDSAKLCADVTEDGEVNVYDLTLLKQRLLAPEDYEALTVDVSEINVTTGEAVTITANTDIADLTITVDESLGIFVYGDVYKTESNEGIFIATASDDATGTLLISDGYTQIRIPVTVNGETVSTTTTDTEETTTTTTTTTTETTATTTTTNTTTSTSTTKATQPQLPPQRRQPLPPQRHIIMTAHGRLMIIP